MREQSFDATELKSGHDCGMFELRYIVRVLSYRTLRRMHVRASGASGRLPLSMSASSYPDLRNEHSDSKQLWRASHGRVSRRDLKCSDRRMPAVHVCHQNSRESCETTIRQQAWLMCMCEDRYGSTASAESVRTSLRIARDRVTRMHRRWSGD
jgi:hypothetical protein